MIKPGSIVKGEPRDGRGVVAGDTVNEFYDPYNKLHFYILDKHLTTGKAGRQFLSYQIGLRHADGKPVSGALTLTPVGAFEAADAGKYAVQTFKLTHSGDANATDIIRITPLGDALVLNNLYALKPGGEAIITVYIKAPPAGLSGLPVTGFALKASSESAAGKEVMFGVL
jgi:hypothetical protein